METKLTEEERKEALNDTIGQAMRLCFLLGAYTNPKLDWFKLVKVLKESFDKGVKIR